MECSKEMVSGYLETARFADCPEASKHFTHGKYTRGDINTGVFTKATQVQARADCEAFLSSLSEEARELADSWDGGSDLWYTRNRRGVGFWEDGRGWDGHNEELTEKAHAMGERNVWAGRYLSIE